MLNVREIEFGYAAPVIKGVTFESGAGQFLAMLGPNGSGKSTLLKVVLGILRPSSGAVEFDGRDMHSISRREAARLIGYVAQEAQPRFPLTALEFVLQGRFAQGRLLGFESEKDLREAEWAMRLTETGDFAGRLVSRLSGGERQRVMLARALSSRPRLLVLDEPVANLDIAHQVKTFELLKRLTNEEGMSAIVVTHELNLAAEYADRVLLLKSGRVVALGPPKDVITRENLRAVFETPLLVDENPVSGAPRVTPIRT
jgi:iron complex transport system ATP-binding protein